MAASHVLTLPGWNGLRKVSTPPCDSYSAGALQSSSSDSDHSILWLVLHAYAEAKG
jgi:hypothetical protein